MANGDDWLKRRLEAVLDELIDEFRSLEDELFENASIDQGLYRSCEKTIIDVLIQIDRRDFINRLAEQKGCSIIVATAAVYAFGYIFPPGDFDFV